MIFNPVIFGASASGLLYIYVAQLPDKRSYYTGENFDPTGMVVKGVNEDLTEVVIPNSALSYIPPMPLTLESELLKLIYTEGGRRYGTTLALDIMIGIWLTQEIPTIPVEEDIELVSLTESLTTGLQDILYINVSDSVGRITVDEDITMISVTESLAPRTPVARAIFEFDISGNAYVTRNANNQVVLQNTYVYNSTSMTIDSGLANEVTIVTSDKASVESVVIE